MYNYNALIPFKIYKKQKVNFIEDKNKVKGKVIFLGGNKEDNLKIMKCPFLHLLFFKSYYTPKNVVMKDDRNATRRIRSNQKDAYNTIKEVNSRIINFKVSVGDYSGKNLMVDLYPYTDNLFTISSKWNTKIKLEKMKDLLINMTCSPDYSEYKDKFLIIPINEKFDNVNDFFKLTNCNSIIVGLYNMIYSGMDLGPLKNLKILVVNPDLQFYFKMDLSMVDRKSIKKLVRNINTINKFAKGEKLTPEEENELNSAEEESKPSSVAEKVTNKIQAKLYNNQPKSFTGEEKELMDQIDSTISQKEEETQDDFELIDKLANDDELKQYVNDLANEKITAKKANQKNARVEQYKQQMAKVKIKDKTIDEIIDSTADKELELEDFEVKSLNSTVKKSTLKDFEKSYNDKLSKKDEMSIVNALADENKSIRMFLQEYNEVDTSDAFTKKVTREYVFKDETGKKHTIKVDFPKFIDDRYLYINGSKKMILKQLVLLPVVKLKPDVVQITGNYRKMFIERYGIKVNPKIERLKKLLPTLNGGKIKVELGDCMNVNTGYLTTLDYDELAANFLSLDIKVSSKSTINIQFNQEKLREESKIEWEKNSTEIPIGYENGDYISLDTKTNLVLIGGNNTNIELLDFIINALIVADSSVEKKITEIPVGKRFMYSRCSILSRDVPLGILLAYHEGLSNLLKKAKIKTEFTDKRKVLSTEEKNCYTMIPFKNGYLYYDMFPISNSLLLSYFNEIDTKNYDYEEFDKKEVYLEYFFQAYGSMNVSKGFDNIIESMIDPITKEVLEDYDLPTEFTELMIYANLLLSDNSYSRENSMEIYRVRSNEIINAYFNEMLIEAYNMYKNTGKAMSVPQDALIKKLLASPLVEEYSILNPVLEAEKLSTTTYKGIGGLNVDRAYSNEKRSYDPSMLGNLALATPDSSKTGAVRTLSFDPNILSTRGYMKAGNNKDVKDISFTNMLSPSEIVTPFVASKDDPPRIGMSTTQNKHVIPVQKTDKLLVGTSAEKALPYLISNDFAYKAKEDGKVIDIKDDLMIIEYKDGNREVVDLESKIAKNGGGGFFMSNKLSTDLKIGSSFKKGDVIACNEQYIKGKGKESEYAVGTLTKVGLFSGAWTFEDSTTVTEKLCGDMTAFVTMKKDLVLGPNSNVDYICKKGQEVKTGDSLIKFENSYDEKEINLLLSKLGDDYKSEIEEMSKNTIHSKYTGVVEDIKIYWNVDEEELSPSLQKIISAYKRQIKSKEKFLKDNNVDTTNLILPSSEKIASNNGKIKGKNIGEGVLIEFYIKYKDIMGVGDKITYYTALKGVIGSVIPDELAPYSEYREDEHIDAILTPFSVISRMTNSIFYTMWINKVLIELKRQIGDIYGIKD